MSHLPQGVKAPPPHSSKFVVRQAPSEPSWSDSMPDDRCHSTTKHAVYSLQGNATTTFLPINRNNDHAHSSHERPPAAGARRVSSKIITTEKNGLIQHHRAMRCTQTILLIHLTPCTHHRSQQYQHGNGKVGATVVALRPSEIAAQYFILGQTSGKKDGKATWPCKDTSQFGWYMPPPFQMSVHFGFSPSIDPCSHIGYNFKRYN